MANLCLGTAQFGLDYGISNETGQPSIEEIQSILCIAREGGIECLDTAAAYGDSEDRLGELLSATPSSFSLITKISPTEPSQVALLLERSLKRLHRPQVAGCMLHDFAVHEKNPAVFQELRKQKDLGKVSKVGISLYYPAQLEMLIQEPVGVELVQVPLNVFDRRFEPLLERAAGQGIEVHVRSIFLQGVVFMDPEALPAHLAPLRPKLRLLRELADSQGVSVASLCLSLAINHPSVKQVVIGVLTARELQTNLDAAKEARALGASGRILDALIENDPKLVVPSLWPAREKRSESR